VLISFFRNARSATRPKPKSKKKRPHRGSHPGQQGHPRKVCKLVPVDRCSEVILLHRGHRRRCGTGLTRTDAELLRRQVWELPVIEPVISEYQRHRLTCSGCETVAGVVC